MTFELPLNKIVTGDCIDILNSFPENSVDLIFADPPYNLQLQQDLWRPNMTKVDAVKDEWDKFDSFEEYDNFSKDWLNAARRVLKKTGTIWVIGSYHNIFRVGKIMQDLRYWILNDIVWIKTNPMPNFLGVRFTNAHETLIWAQKQRGEKYTFNHHTMKALNDDKQMRSDWEIPICPKNERLTINGKKVHSTQKPEALLYRIIQSSSNPGDIILDPFFGSGTSGVIAKKLNRKWIGIEKDKKYISASLNRLNAAKALDTDNFILATKSRNQGFKIPFGKLVELGIINPGTKLYLDKTGKEAIVLADGHIISDDIRGSIHTVSSKILGTQCNGWIHWQYQDINNNLFYNIDGLRKIAEIICSEEIEGEENEKRQSN